MRAVLLTAGCSRRLRPLTDTTPKCLLSVGGEPILKRSIENLCWAGVNEIIVITGFYADKVESAVNRWFPKLNVQYFHNPDFATTNNAYSLRSARPAVFGKEFFLLDGDLVFDADIISRLAAHGPNCVAVRTIGDIGLEEVKVQVDQNSVIKKISKEVSTSDSLGESIGIALFSKHFAKRLFETLEERVIKRGFVDEYYEASFQQVIDQGAGIKAVDIERCHAIEIDTAEDLAAANDFLLGRRSRIKAPAI